MPAPITPTDAARVMIQEVQNSSSAADWSGILELLRILTALSGDYPNELLYAIVGKSEDEVLRLAAEASGIVQTTDTGKMVLRPPEVGEVVVSSVYSSQADLTETLSRMVRTMVTHVATADSSGEYCGQHLGRYLKAAGDSRLVVQVLDDDAIRRLIRLGCVPVLEVMDLLLLRARAALELNMFDVTRKSLLMAGILFRDEKCRTASGDLLLELWQTKQGAAAATNVPCNSTGEGIVLLLALAEAATYSKSEHLLGILGRLCSEIRRTQQEKPNDGVAKLFNQRWAYRYAGEVVAALAGRSANAALQLHETLLMGVNHMSDVGAIFDYAAHLLSSLIGDAMALGCKILQLSVDRSAALIPALPESPSFPSSAISGDTISSEAREREKRSEWLRAQFVDATIILRKATLSSKKQFQKDLEARIHRLWEETPPHPGTRIDDLVRFHGAANALPNRFLPILTKGILDDLQGDFHIAPYSDCQTWLKACRILAHEKDTSPLIEKVINAVLNQPTEEILFKWPLVTDFNFCAALLQAASAAGTETLTQVWKRLWESANKLPSRSGERLAGVAKLLEECSSAGLESLEQLMRRSLSQARFSDKEKLALRASLSSAPGDGADHKRCREVPASLVSVQSLCAGTVPSPHALARFLAMCVDEGLLEPLELASRFNDLVERNGLVGRDEFVFLTLICRAIQGISARRAVLSAMRTVIGAREHMEICLRVEEMRPGTLTSSDLNQESSNDLSEDDFATFLYVQMSSDRLKADALLARVPAIREVPQRALIIHQYIRHTNQVPQFQTERGVISPLPADQVIGPFITETMTFDLTTLSELEGFLPYNLTGFRILHQASAKVTGSLPEAFLARQVERLLPALRTRGDKDGRTQAATGDKEQDFKHSDGVQIAEELLRCGDVKDQLHWIDAIIRELPACGRWITVGFLDSVGPLLKSHPIPGELLMKLETLPQAFEERYHPAFCGRIIRYLGDSNAEPRKLLWNKVRGYWIAESQESVFNRAARLANGCSLLPPEDLCADLREDMIRAITKVLKNAESAGGSDLMGVLGLLLANIGEWRAWADVDLEHALGTVLDSARLLRKSVSDTMMGDVLKGLAETAKDEKGMAFLEKVCSSTSSRWAALFEVFGAKCDSDGDLDHDAEALVEQLVSKVWPGENVVRAWLSHFAKWDGADRLYLVSELAPAMAANVHGQKWAAQFKEFVASAKPEPPQKEWQQFLAYAKSQVDVVLFAKDPEHYSGKEKLILTDRDDYKRVWLCLRAAPSAPGQKEIAVALLQKLVELDPPLGGRDSGRSTALSLVSELFAEHEWRAALAEGALDAIRAEKSIAKRFHFILAVAQDLKSVGALRAALDLFTYESLLQGIQGATADDLELIFSAAAVFQVHPLYQTLNSKAMSASNEEVRDIQRHACAYRRHFLGEDDSRGPCWEKLSPSFHMEIHKTKLEAAAFTEKEARWALSLARAAAAVGGDLQNADLPVQYWWYLARCARIAQSPELVQLLARLHHRMPDGVALPNNVTGEIMMTLHDSVSAPCFSQMYGLIGALFLAADQRSCPTTVGLPARLQMQVMEACNSLS